MQNRGYLDESRPSIGGRFRAPAEPPPSLLLETGEALTVSSEETAPAQSKPPEPACSPVGNRPRAKACAEAVVRELLADGPAPGDGVKAAAVEAKVSERTLIAEAERLGVRSKRGQW